MRRLTVILLALVLALPASAGLNFQRLDDDRFLINHKKRTRFGDRGRAMKTLYAEVAAICVAAGYDYFEIKEQHVQGQTLFRGASAMMDVRFHREEANDDVIACAPLADPGEVRKARKQLGR